MPITVLNGAINFDAGVYPSDVSLALLSIRVQQKKTRSFRSFTMR